MTNGDIPHNNPYFSVSINDDITRIGISGNYVTNPPFSDLFSVNRSDRHGNYRTIGKGAFITTYSTPSDLTPFVTIKFNVNSILGIDIRQWEKEQNRYDSDTAV